MFQLNPLKASDSDLLSAWQRFFQDGVIAVPQAAGTEATAALATARSLSRRVRRALQARGIAYQGPAAASWRFSECASRGRGRFDVRFAADDNNPFAALLEHLDRTLAPLFDGVFGEGLWSRNFAGLVDSLPQSEAQQWHTDGQHLFAGMELPPHAATCFVALQPLVAECPLGCPQFAPGSHISKAAKALEEGVELDVVHGEMQAAGDAILFDYRLVHRGVENSSRDEVGAEGKWIFEF